ncbi:hypothetical protein MKW98_014456 [Papaver atlanticum]|uniref:Uncharacterized protein n=1 Tax=Papaver atlanticum TaxID=357466 RepID=A0AAD4S010_9MAGN|nr:hypothetical protein MKW98_014456 [Papaver atlanticum]
MLQSQTKTSSPWLSDPNSSPEFHINLQFLLTELSRESRCKSLSPTAAALSLLNQSKVKLELCSLENIESRVYNSYDVAYFDVVYFD